MFLIDANIIISAQKRYKDRIKFCERVLIRNNIATTNIVDKEIKNNHELFTILYQVKKIDPEIKELFSKHQKQPGQKDLSLIQAAKYNPEIAGIITYDKDFKHIATRGFINLNTKRKYTNFFLDDAKRFCIKFNLV
jgi:predicted nucleic acid-binding protein